MAAALALETAFSAAATHLGVPRLLEPADFEEGHPVDDKTIILCACLRAPARACSCLHAPAPPPPPPMLHAPAPPPPLPPPRLP